MARKGKGRDLRDLELGHPDLWPYEYDERVLSNPGGGTLAYVRMETSAKIARTEEVAPEVFVDFDKKGNVVGVEVVGHVKTTKLCGLWPSACDLRKTKGRMR